MRPVTRFLVRAPLLPLAAAGLDASPLGAEALRLASPDLAAGLERGDAGAARAAARYAVRARFRATPHGLLAGVGVGRLGDATRVDTGAPAAHTTPSYARLHALARAALDDPAARRRVRLRAAPSLLRHGDHVMWLGPDGDALEAAVDDVLAAALAAARRWTPWPRVARALGGDDDVVLALVDDGLLCSELTPPLVGPPPADWLRARGVAVDGPGEVHATLTFPDADVTVDRAVVERAAALAPLLVRLAAALMPPTAERELDPGVAEAARVAAETFGPGALDTGTFALGGYGARPDEGAAFAPAQPPAALLTLLLDRFSRGGVVKLTAAELDRVLPPAPVPATLELQLTPRREPDGWLLGWHAPAGATWGRFAHAFPPLLAPLRALAALEPPGRLDVAFAPDPSLGDLAAHPPVRAQTLALTTWPDAPALTPADLAVVAPPPLALDGGTPSPLHRLRSTTAPPGVYQLLAGWSLHRQHAPWALVLPAALADLDHTPRVELDGFVIAPASWRLPHPDAPPMVQAGHEDELLPVASGETGGRVWEIWPPLEEPPVDAGGRRVEIVVALVGEEAPRPPARKVDTAPDPRWRTFLLHGPRDRQDRLLLEAVAPTIAAARRARVIDGWFFLRYIDGARHHLRVRVRGDATRFARRLERALGPARAAGDLVTTAEAPYHPERARYPKPVEKWFEDDSDRALADLDADDVALVAALDAAAARLGLDLRGRHDLAAALRAAHEPHPDADAAFRAHARALRAALATTPRVRGKPHPNAADLVHLAINRRAGVDPAREALLATLWQRTLEGLAFTGSPASPGTPRRPRRT